MKTSIRSLCSIQEYSLSHARIRTLEKQIAGTYEKHFGINYKLTFIWIIIPKGQAFTTAEPSTASSILLPVPDGLETKARHQFMYEISDLWLKTTGCSKNEFILNAPDFEYAQMYMKTVSARFKPSSRLMTQLRLASRLIKSKLKHGYFSMGANIS